ncbi:glycogen debranching protein [Chamaesiphon sp. VAR_48_metabat_135_sub]|jgi:hypothetical protein|uniref:glycogen debranching protein n=1 Tax=Chamaesiphon sp. VAR_48_metabat_135_sub TaxID=2964699 RepID=UPI00286BC0F1|nr:glycogen debranching protein [Chamaesiphon sp. VAR_48_metabat_135_sub]
MLTIWVNEQLDPGGLMYACIATRSEELARECHESFDRHLTTEQKQLGWIASLRTVGSWDEVPVNSLNLG